MKAKFPDVKNLPRDWGASFWTRKKKPSIPSTSPRRNHMARPPIGYERPQTAASMSTARSRWTRYRVRSPQGLAEAATAKETRHADGAFRFISHEAHKDPSSNSCRSGGMGKIHTVYSWIGKGWGDASPRPEPTAKGHRPRKPSNWDRWLGGRLHAALPRRQLLSPPPKLGANRPRFRHPAPSATWAATCSTPCLHQSRTHRAHRPSKCTEGGVNAHNWGPTNRVEYRFPARNTPPTRSKLFWCDGKFKPPEKYADGDPRQDRRRPRLRYYPRRAWLARSTRRTSAWPEERCRRTKSAPVPRS